MMHGRKNIKLSDVTCLTWPGLALSDPI